MRIRRTDEPCGGDLPCQAHVFDDAACPGGAHGDDGPGAVGPTGSNVADVGVVDLASLARSGTAQGTAWTHQGEDLNANLLVFVRGGGVAEHVNAEVDVLLVGITGEGTVEIDERRHILQAGQALIVPKGTRRAIRALSTPFAYLTCHRRRVGLWPAGVRRSNIPSPGS